MGLSRQKAPIVGGSGFIVPKLARGESLSLIVRNLRQDILDGRLKPGERIHQEVIAGRLGTSRSPVREALRQLQTEGLVVINLNAGARVAGLQAAELEEIYLLRERLEPLAIERSAVLLSDDQMQALRMRVEQMERLATEQGPGKEWLEADQAFHSLSVSAAGLPRLLQLIESYANVSRPYRRVYLGLDPDVIAMGLVEHQLLLEALERRSGTDAAQLLEVHIRRTRLGLAAHPEIFARIRGTDPPTT